MDTLYIKIAIGLAFFLGFGIIAFINSDKNSRKHQLLTASGWIVISLIFFFVGSWGISLESPFLVETSRFPFSPAINWLLLILATGSMIAAFEELFYGEIASKIFKNNAQKEEKNKESKKDPISKKPGRNPQNMVPLQKSTKSKRKTLFIVGGIFVLVVGLVIALVSIFANGLWKHNTPSYFESTFLEDTNDDNTLNHFNEQKVREIVESYCNAIVDNDFDKLTELYAPIVEKYQAVEDKDREYVVGCHRRYDDKFKVYGKHSSLRWNTFNMEEINGEDRLGVSIVEDYSLDREDPNKYSVFVLEKHFVLNGHYQIVSVYDVQLEKSKTPSQSNTNKELAANSYEFIKKEYAKANNGALDIGKIHGKVDFRDNKSFSQLIKNIVYNDKDYNTIMSSNVIFTEYSDSGNGRVECFDIKGNKYTISFNIGMRSEYSIVITVNGEKYEWISLGYNALF